MAIVSSSLGSAIREAVEPATNPLDALRYRAAQAGVLGR